MIQNSERMRAKAFSSKPYAQRLDKQRKSLMLKGDNDGRYRQLKQDVSRGQFRSDKQRTDKQQYRRKRQSVPELVIDLHEQRSTQPPFLSMMGGYITKLSSSGKKEREAISEKLMFPNSNNPLLESSKKTSSSYKNMNLKTKNCEHLRQEIQQIRSENLELREENRRLRKKLERVDRLEQIYDFTTKQNAELKKQKDRMQQQRRELEEKQALMKEQFEGVVARLKVLYEQLIEEKRRNKSIREFVVRAEKQCYLQEQLFSRESIFKNSFERYEHDGKLDYYTSVRQAQRQRPKRQYHFSGIFN